MKKAISDLTRQDIECMDYNQLIGLVRETNRPPGGLRSIVRIAQNSFLNDRKKVLEIGTSTGITAIELARLTSAHIYGIDINPASLKEARERSERYGVANKTEFCLEDATNLSFAPDYFDLVFCGNVTSLISDRRKALAEYSRVLKAGGILAAIPMYYVRPPSTELVEAVSEAIQVKITPHDKQYWMDFFNVEPFHTFLTEDYTFDHIEQGTVDIFAQKILASEHLQELKPEVKQLLDEKYTRHMQLFRENLSHMGYSLLLLRKEHEPMDPELFTSTRVR